MSVSSINLADSDSTTSKSYNGSVYMNITDFSSKADWLNAAINQTKLQYKHENTTVIGYLKTAKSTYDSSVTNKDSSDIQTANKKAWTEAKSLNTSLKYLNSSVNDLNDALSGYQDGNNLTYKESLAANKTHQTQWSWAYANYSLADIEAQIARETDATKKTTLSTKKTEISKWVSGNAT